MSVAYRSEQYALLNTPVEIERHVQRVIRHLSPAAADQILELGCGRGFITRRIQHYSPSTLGIDVNPEAIRHGVTSGLRVMDAANLSFEDASFDKVYSFHTIEHLPDVERALGEIARVLRPNGRVLIVYPAEPIRGLFAVPSAVRMFRNPLRARDLHLHRLTPRKLRERIAADAVRLTHVRSELALLLTPQFLTVLVKR